jgi:hypothetical protein
MKLRTHNIALALLVAAVGAPAAHAGNSANQPTRVDTSDVVSRYLHNQAQASRADTSDVVSRYLRNHTQASRGETSDVVSRYLRNHTQASKADTSDVVSRYLRNHTQALAATTLPIRNGVGFDWAEAAIGAGGLLGIILLAGTVTLVMRQTRRRVTSA